MKKNQILISDIFVLETKSNLKKKPLTVRDNLNAACVRIKFVTNNIYCTFWSISGKQTWFNMSVGTKNLKASKRGLMFYSKILLELFFAQLQRWKINSKKKDTTLVYSLRVPKKFRKIILNIVAQDAAAINFEGGKSFNGCKVKKKRRKKRLGFRSFK